MCNLGRPEPHRHFLRHQLCCSLNASAWRDAIIYQSTTNIETHGLMRAGDVQGGLSHLGSLKYYLFRS